MDVEGEWIFMCFIDDLEWSMLDEFKVCPKFTNYAGPPGTLSPHHDRQHEQIEYIYENEHVLVHE